LLARGTGHREWLTFGDGARHDAATLLEVNQFVNSCALAIGFFSRRTDTETMKLIPAEVRYPVGGFHHRPLVAAMLTGVCELEIVTMLRDCGDCPEPPLVGTLRTLGTIIGVFAGRHDLIVNRAARVFQSGP
jgi:hypothetical protein